MKILSLKSENVKKLTAVQINPDGNMVVIGGKNKAGKSSVIDSIVYAFAGKRAIAEKPLRDGAKSGKIVIETDGDEARSLSPLRIERTFTEDGKSQLEIKSKDGYKAPSPQTILDDLCAGGVAFDPLAFVRMNPREQADMLRKLVGLDFSTIDAEHKRIFDERTEVNREAKATKARADAIAIHEDAPAELVSVADLMTELSKRQAANASNSEARERFDKATDAALAKQDEATEADEYVATVEKSLAAAKEKAAAKHKAAKDAELALAELKKSVDALEDVPTAPISEQIANAETINARVRANMQRADLDAELAGLREKSEDLTAKLKNLDDEKASQLSAAKWPIEGLGFDESGITLNGLPFSQSSSAESLEVAFAMGIATCPGLRVFIIRDGSLLDEESLARVADIAEKADVQLWIERVGTGEECSVIIEDGHVKVEEAEAVGA